MIMAGRPWLWPWLLGVSRVAAQGDVLTLTGTKSLSVTEATIPTGTYITVSSKISLGSSEISSGATTIAGNATDLMGSTTTTPTVTFLTGSVQTSSSTTTLASGNFSVTSTSTSSSAAPTNTQPCNNYAEFCDRKYSNITMVAAHNSPFVRAGSAAANQQYDVVSQLNDGVRFLQAQIQWPANGTQPHFCHTSCDLLDAGPITTWLSTVRDWVAAHPYEVVTILLGNGNYSKPALYAPFIEASGILQYAYTPPVFPMQLDDWPTLSWMILRGQRVVMFLDYEADPPRYPWLLDEFSQMWETPFDPVDQAFPCTVQRPPALAADAARDRLYLMNHNFNVEVSLLGASILVPAVSELNVTNAADGFGSLGAAANNCRSDWGRAPNFLNVDYYNIGSTNGSVFEVAARMNNVTYDRPCCGPGASGGGLLRAPAVTLLLSLYAGLWLLL